MTELELLRAFFHRWEEFHLLPMTKGRKSKEHEAAATAMVDAARQVKDYVAPQSAPVYDPATQDFRLMQQQIAAIPPKDGFKSGIKMP